MRPVFLGTEASQAPEVVELVALGRKIAERVGPRAGGLLSMRNGPRCIANVGDLPFGALGLGDFVEVADYDPKTGQIFFLGTRTPGADAPLHAMVYRAKAEVGAIAQVPLPQGHAALKDVEVVERDARPVIVASTVLRLLRETDAVAIGGTDLLVASPALPRLAKRLDALLEAPKA